MNKQLTVRSIEKIKVIYDSIKKLDAEIIELDKMGMLISEKKTEISLSLNVKDIEQANKKKVKFDEDGSLVTDGIQRITAWGSLFTLKLDGSIGEATTKPKEDCVSSVNYQIEESVAYLIIGNLMAEKQRERDMLLMKLERYGFKV